MRKEKETEKKSLRIAMFGHKQVFSREGGIEVVVTELATRMAGLGHHVSCYNRSYRHRPDERAHPPVLAGKGDLQVKEVLTINRKGLSALSSSFFAALKIAFSRFDVIHIHAEGPAIMTGLLKAAGKKVVVTIHGLDWKRDKWNRLASWMIRRGERKAVRKADSIIVLSKSAKDYFQKEYGRKTEEIPNGVNPPEIAAPKQITEKWNLKKDEYVLYVGRIVPEKGLECLVEAWSNLNTNKKLAIVGRSSDTQQFTDALQQAAGDNILFTGFLEGRELQEFFSNAYFYVLPSSVEGMPISLLEAMSYGNCCLTSDIPECRDVVEGHGVTFPCGDAKKLAAVMQRLIDHPEEVERYKKDVADYICRKYNWDKTTELTLECYYSACGYSRGKE